MRIRPFTLDDVPLERATQVYRDASWRALGLVVLIMSALPMVIVWANPYEKNNIALVAFTAAVALFCFILFLRQFIRAMRKHHWLLAQAEEGLYLNLLHHHRQTQETGKASGALFIPRAMIAAVGKTHESRRFEGRYGHERHFAYIDLYLTLEDTGELRAALRRERRKLPHARDFKCHVRLPAPGVVRLLWDRVYPPENTAIELLARDYATMADRSVKYADWARLSKEEKALVVHDLWETGHVEEAVRLHRIVTGDDFHTTRAYFARLAQED